MLFRSLLIVSSLFNFALGRWFGATPSAAIRKTIVVLGVAGNLSLLGYFKYYDFLSAEVRNLSAAFGAVWVGAWM